MVTEKSLSQNESHRAKENHFDTGNKTSFLKYFILEQEERTQIYTKAETNDDF